MTGAVVVSYDGHQRQLPGDTGNEPVSDLALERHGRSLPGAEPPGRRPPQLPETCLVVLICASGAGKSTLAGTWPASQVLSLDVMREAVSDDFSVKFTVLSTS